MVDKKVAAKKAAPKIKKEVVKVAKKPKLKVAKEETVKKVEKVEKVKKEDNSGKYVSAIGRRKTATAQVRLYENGKGVITVNGKKLADYFPGDAVNLITQPLKLLGKARDFNITVITHGGGQNGQMEAVRHGISRALLKMDEAVRPTLRTAGYLTRDRRKKERKKPGLKKARKAPQWSKR